MKEILSKLIRGIMGRDIRTHASSIAFFFFMALIPLLILLASVVPFFGISADNVMQFFQEILASLYGACHQLWEEGYKEHIP